MALQDEDVLQTFLAAKEENLVSFLRTFVELSAAERAALSMEGPQSADIDEKEFAAAVETFRDVDAVPHATGDVVLEEVELDESVAVRTCAMTAFLTRGMVDIVPTYGNFIGVDESEEGGEGEDVGELARQRQAAEVATTTGDREISSERDGVMGSPATGKGKSLHLPLATAAAASASASGAVESVFDKTRDGCDDSVSDGAIELPGLAVNDVSPGSGAPPGVRNGVFLSATEVNMLLEGGDDEVQPFVIDPYFDYDADPVGRAARLHPRRRV
ncbi:hypothetical protein DQ04_00351060 [Trypanosoma grayi]|uniref:hypothetical protein n=1 Tax=Trypanosoma grayi TaxID=71804 RepID=UPI0004F4B390|nr:hypothetical protein DQ04_00351060 [Trypanosoma grayi]KEG14669.1 hypothetical protein DQ04_00351060 [Trypanosoma grayi]